MPAVEPGSAAGGFEKNVIHFDKTAKVMRVLAGFFGGFGLGKREERPLDGELKTRLNEIFVFTGTGTV